MTASWTITGWPRCVFDVFLSHCAEDRDNLVHPLKDRLEQLQILPWLDRDHYPYGRPPDEALRSGLMQCRHIAYIITDEYVKQPRGWTCWESGYSAFIDSQLSLRGQTLQDFQILLFLTRDSDAGFLQRSVWGTLRQRGKICPPGGDDNARVEWAAEAIKAHVLQNLRLAEDWKRLLPHDRDLAVACNQTFGLRERILGL